MDHEDGDGLNNQRANLRLATRSQNKHNHRLGRGRTSQYVGVSYLDPTKPQYAKYAARPYKAYIKLGNKQKHVGFFATEEEAALARDAVARELHGEFAVLNFP